MFCTSCGSKIDDGSAFCPVCGAKLPPGGMQTGGQSVPIQQAAPMSQGAPMQQGYPNQAMNRGTVSLPLFNIDHIPGQKIKALGMVLGNSAQTRNAGKDLVAGFKNMAGGEVKEYRELAEAARQTALSRMMDMARAMGADAVVSVCFNSAAISVSGIVEVMAYGTAVKYEKEPVETETEE